MRVRRLVLDELGHFRGHQVELDAPPGALRVVVGPNEAGKSTLRAGIRAALFGIEGSYLQGTPKAAVRLAAELDTADGAELVVVRHGGRAARDGDGHPIDPDVLSKSLGVDRALFDTLCHLGHDELRRHGAALLQDDGDVGTLLFGAVLGGPAVIDTLERLEAEASAIYTPRARTRRINELLSSLTEADAVLAEATVAADHYAERLERRDWVRDRLTTLRADRAERVALRRDHERILAIAPQLAHRADLQRQVDRLGGAGPRATAPQVDVIRSRTASRERALSERVRVAGSLERVRSEVRSVAPDERLLDAAPDIDRLAERLESFRSDLADLDEPAPAARSGVAADVDPAPLEEALVDTQGAVTTLELLDESDARLDGLEGLVATRLAALGAGDLQPELLIGLPVPSRSETEAVLAVSERDAARIADLTDRIADLEHQRDEVASSLAELEAHATVPDLAEVAAARARRDEAWSRARGRLVGEPWPDDDPGITDRSVVDEVDAALSTADELADRVLSDTERATLVRAARESLTSLDERLARLAHDLTEAEARLATASSAWADRWEGLPIAAPTPAEATRWHDDWERMIELVADTNRTRAEVERRRHSVRVASDRLRAVLAVAGVEISPDAGLAALRARVEALVADLASLRAEIERRELARQRVELVRARLEPMLDLLPEGDRSADADAVSALRRLLALALTERDRRDHLLARERELAEELADIESTIAADDEHLARVAKQLGVETGQLDTVAERSEQIERLDEQLAQVEVLVREAGGELDADGGIDTAERERWIEVLGDEIAQLDEEIEAHNRELGELEVELSRIGGGEAAADAASRRQEILAELDTVVEDYTVLRLAHGLLERVVAETGSGRHDELLDRAGELLTILTDGAAVALDVEEHPEGRQAVVVRADGSRRGPGQLSDGTLDQLWLALRLAGVEYHLERRGPVPLVVDDALVHFDDRRASAALEVLGHLAERTQVICLTHHPHLVELATERLGADRVYVTRLEPRSSAATPAVAVIDHGHAGASVPEVQESDSVRSGPTPGSPTLFDPPDR